MTIRDQIETLLADVSRRREEAQAEAAQAGDNLVRLAGGIAPLEQIDPESVRASADAYAAAMDKLKMLAEVARELRGLLI